MSRAGRMLAPAAAALMLGLLAGVNVYRAATLGITIDEAHTYTTFVAAPLGAMRTYYEANNHILYTLLAKASVAVFGPGDFWLRLPSVAAGILYFLAVWVLARRLAGAGGWFLLAVALCSLNPYLLDFLSAARGYGLAMALWLWALYLLMGATAPGRVAAAGALMGLSVGTNLVMAVPCAALGAAFVIQAAQGGWRPAARQAALPMPLSSPNGGILPNSSGADPQVCAGPPGPASRLKRQRFAGNWGRPGGRPRTWASAPQLMQVSGGGKTTWHWAAWLGGTAAAVASPVLWLGLQSASRGNFYFGAGTVKEAAFALSQGSLYHRTSFLHANLAVDHLLRDGPYWVMMAGLLAALAVAAWDALASRGSEAGGERRAQAGLVLWTLAGSALLLAILKKGFGVPYPYGRTGLYLIPLFSLAAVILLLRLPGRAAAAVAVPLVCLSAFYVFHFDVRSYYDFRDDAPTKRMVEHLEQIHRGEGGRAIHLAASRMLLDGYLYYRKARGLDWLDAVLLDGNLCLNDYYAVLPEDRAALAAKYPLEPEYREAGFAQSLLRFQRGAMPELEALRALGYDGAIACPVDFRRVDATVDTAQAEDRVHYLRDVLEAPGPDSSLWVADRPALVFRLPGQGPLRLSMEYYAANVVLERTGPLKLAVRLNGRELGSMVADSEGRKTWSAAVPGGWLRPDGLAVVEILPDKCFVAEDGQKLSVLLRRVLFEKAP